MASTKTAIKEARLLAIKQLQTSGGQIWFKKTQPKGRRAQQTNRNQQNKKQD